MYSLLMRTSPKHYVGKDRQHTRKQLCRSVQDTRKMQDARGVCGLEKSSSVFNGSLLKSANILFGGAIYQDKVI